MADKTKRLTFPELSRLDWAADLRVDASGKLEYPGMERLLVGCAMRIANATEKMSFRMAELQDQVHELKQENIRIRTINRGLRDTINSQNLAIHQLKKKLATEPALS